ncbi:MAG TPA: 2-hydroxyacyl-CoA dehydratase family protein [Anaerolineales bacterium]|nr:2-hydroxyacyl-CoA dehydratase family protein [Anaerolineales bacterium]
MDGAPSNPQPIVGRANRDGADLFRRWYQDLARVAESGAGAAYVFVMGSMAEVLRVFDLPMVFPEINSLQTAVRRVADQYLSQAEDEGYSPDICGYVKADVAVQLRGGEHPMGRIPRPSLAVLTNACNTYIKWAEIWERMYHVPVFVLDVPGTRAGGAQTWPGHPDFETDRRYVASQIQELIAICEQVTSRRFDIDRLREVLGYANQMSGSWRRALELNQSVPAVFSALTDGTIYLGVSNAFRGTAEGSEYFAQLVEEMAYKAAHGIGTIQEEKHRLVFVGVPCYPIFRRFYELFAEWGGVFVSSTYLWFASGGTNLGFEYDLRQPLESLAEGVLISVRHAMDSMFYQDRMLDEMAEPFGVDGVVYHPIKSCRTVSTGLADSRRAFMQARDIPCLFIESDMMDKRVVSEAQMKNRIDAFFEGLNARKLQRAVA